MTLRDAVADISVPVTCSRALFDGLNPPLVEGASVVVHAKPSYYANRGTLSLDAREIRMVGLGELLARLERRRQLLAAEGLFAPELKRPLPFLPRSVGLVTAPNSAAERDVLENARRRWPAVAFEVAYAAMQGTARGRRGDRGGRAPRPRPRGRRDRGRPRRRLGRGPAAVLRRGADPGRREVPDPGRLRDRPRARPAAARPGRRRARLHADRRGQAGRARRRRGAARRGRAAASGCAPRSAGWLDREQDPARRAPLPARARRPAHAARRARRRGRGAARPGPAHPRPPARPRRRRRSPTSAPGPARCRRWPPCSAATPCSRTPTATCVTSVGRRRGRASGSPCGSPTAGCMRRRPRPRP